MGLTVTLDGDPFRSRRVAHSWYRCFRLEKLEDAVPPMANESNKWSPMVRSHRPPQASSDVRVRSDGKRLFALSAQGRHRDDGNRIKGLVVEARPE